MFDIITLNKKKLPELQEIGKDLGIEKYRYLKKQALIDLILKLPKGELNVAENASKAQPEISLVPKKVLPFNPEPEVKNELSQTNSTEQPIQTGGLQKTTHQKTDAPTTTGRF